MAKNNNLTDFLTDVADAIRAKKGTQALIDPQDFSSEIASIQPTLITKTITENGTYNASDDNADGYSQVVVNVGTDVLFYDYDGTIVASYSKSDFLQLTEMPENPSHTGLVAQGWNWNLTDAKAYVTAYGMLDIGQMYKTSSGLSEFDIELNKKTGLTISFKMSGNTNWGDGTTEVTTSSSTHTYAAYGKYTITCDGTSLRSNIFGNSSTNINYSCTNIRLGQNLESSALNVNNLFCYCRSLTTITIPSGPTRVNQNLFQGCSSLIHVTLPDTLGTGSAYYQTFTSCVKLASVSLPKSGTTVNTGYMFQNCSSIKRVTLPETITTLATTAFAYCSSIRDIILPTSITTFNEFNFQECYNLKNLNRDITDAFTSMFAKCYNITNIKFSSTTTLIRSNSFNNCFSCLIYDFSALSAIPTLQNTNAFTGINSLAKIVVPDSLYSQWITESNWVTYADYIYKASEVVL